MGKSKNEQEMALAIVQEIVGHFKLEGSVENIEVFGNGHINITYLVEMLVGDASYKCIIQNINKLVFKDPEKVIENIIGVTSYLKDKISKEGGDENRETLTLIEAVDGKYFYKDSQGDYYRIYTFIEGATCYDTVTPELFYSSAKAFGKFAKQLDGYDASQLHDAIPKFHDTVNRYQNFEISLEENVCGRKESCVEEIAFVTERKEFCSIILDEIKNGAIPLRVCHNDTKLNNVMIDEETHEGVCVIDLDTIMKGSLLYDFGDSIRFGASSALEDEENLDKVYCDLDKYEMYVKGYLEETADILSEKEFELLGQSAILMTFECGIRFLTDYLSGDTYFRIHRENHNLARARNQFKLVEDMEAKLEEMTMINEKYKKRG